MHHFDKTVPAITMECQMVTNSLIIIVSHMLMIKYLAISDHLALHTITG